MTHSTRIARWLLAPLVALLLAPRAALAGSPEEIGLYPLALPDGQKQFEDKLAGQLHDGAAGLPGVRAFDLVPRGACLPDEGGCLASAARSARLVKMVSGSIALEQHGYSFALRLYAAKDGALLAQEKGAVSGGPLDLAGALEHGVCALLGGAPCLGALAIRGEEPQDGQGVHLFIDGKDAGALPLARPVALPVGRHLVRAGDGETRVRISYQRESKLLCAQRAGALALLEEAEAGAPPALASAAPANQGAIPAPTSSMAIPAPPLATSTPTSAVLASSEPRSRIGMVLMASGGALLMTALGAELYARSESAALDARYQSGQLGNADAPSYGHVHAAGVAAMVLGAVGAGAAVAGGVIFLLSPSGAGVQGSF